MTQNIPNSLVSKLKSDYDGMVELLMKKGYIIESLPENLESKKDSGESIAFAYPIQGMLKYHGLVDDMKKIAFFPSISLNNDCAHTISYLKFDKSYEEDSAVINGKNLHEEELSRINECSIMPEYTKVKNPAFDVTPSKYVKGFITEEGIIKN